MREYYDDRYPALYAGAAAGDHLLAVIIAVPVVMWTITTMVRTYVAAPKAPTFQRMTDTQPPGDAVSDTSAAAPASVTPPAQLAPPTPQLADAQAAATQARTALLEIKKPADTPSPSAPPPAAAARGRNCRAVTGCNDFGSDRRRAAGRGG